MISQIRIRHLKSIDELTIGLGQFTLLAGMNSAGKSTFIQALLLAIQNTNESSMSPINGDLVALGHFSDARNFIKNAREFEIEVIAKNGESIELRFVEENGHVACETTKQSTLLLDFLDVKNKRIKYLSSKRIGSQDTYENNFNRYNDLGTNGEYAIDYFNNNKKEVIPEYLLKDRETSLTLEGQVNYWLKYIINGELLTEDIAGTDHVRAQFAYGDSRPVRPKNIGSGLSYIISIVVAGLSSVRQDLIIIENPEIHLHPRAQSRLTEFMTFIANQGVKFIVETHSDHIFNGLRKSISKSVIDKDEVYVYFFKLDSEYLTTSTKIEFDNNGNVKNHQSGLFDQFDDDLDELLGL